MIEDLTQKENQVAFLERYVLQHAPPGSQPNIAVLKAVTQYVKATRRFQLRARREENEGREMGR
jgi:hypothetical protein